ncbi:MAG: DUF6035 family protein [Devosia sp.]
MQSAQLAEQRLAINTARSRGEALYRCHECSEPVYIARTFQTDGNGGLHFRHFQSEVAKACKWRIGGSVRDLGAIRFNGRQEGNEHFRLKHALAEALAQDSYFWSVAVEKQIVGETTGTRRQPDVSARFLSGELVGFDLQLAGMSVKDIAGRNSFYLENDIHHVWLTSASDLERLRTQSFQDIYFATGASIYCASPAALEASEAEGQLQLDELQVVPNLGDKGIYCSWQVGRVDVERILRDLPTRQAYGIAAFGRALSDQVDQDTHQAVRRLRDASMAGASWPSLAANWTIVAKAVHGRNGKIAQSDNVHLMLAWLALAEELTRVVAAPDGYAAEFNHRTAHLLAARNAANWVSLIDLVLTRHQSLNKHLDRDHLQQIGQMRRQRVTGHYQQFHRSMIATCFPFLAYWLLAKAPDFPPHFRT